MNKLSIISFAACAFVAATLSSAGAHAQVTALTCPGTLSATYVPGITLTEQSIDVDATGSFGPCVGVPLSVPPLSATFTASGGGDLSCTSGTASFDADIDWSDNTSSTAELVAMITPRVLGGAVAAYSGVVTGGRFAGANITITVVMTTTELLDCVGDGVDYTSGVATGVIASL